MNVEVKIGRILIVMYDLFSIAFQMKHTADQVFQIHEVVSLYLKMLFPL